VVMSRSSSMNVIDLVLTPGRKLAIPPPWDSQRPRTWKFIASRHPLGRQTATQRGCSVRVFTNPDGRGSPSCRGTVSSARNLPTDIVSQYEFPPPRVRAKRSSPKLYPRLGISVKHSKAWHLPMHFTVHSCVLPRKIRFAEKCSPPLANEIKVTIKVRQNIHAVYADCI